MRFAVIPAILALALILIPQPKTGASRLVLASATDPRGRALVDVGADDFVIQEGGATREVLSVRLADYPIVVLLDASAGADDFALMQKAAVHFIERLGGERPVIAGVFGDGPKLLATFDDDRKTVLERISSLTPAKSGSSQLLAGVAFASETLRATGALFSAVVVLSAAPASTAHDGDASPVDDDAIGRIVESGAIVHVIGNQATAGGRAVQPLRGVVDQTRGEYTPIYAAASYQAALDRLADRLSNELLIEYLVPPGSKPNDVKVGIRIPGVRVRGLGVAPR
jgi:hypothetical protein